MNLGQPLLDKEGYARVLGTMREKTLVSEIKESAEALDLQRLRWLVEFGVFKAQPLLDLQPQIGTIGAEHLWSERCEAAMAVMALARLVPQATRMGKEIDKLAKLDIPIEARQFFSGLCLLISTQMEVMAHALPTLNRSGPTMVQAMSLAGMLDEPEVLQRLADTHPNSVLGSFEDGCIAGGLFMRDLGEKNSTMAVTPLFCALAFSSTACVKVLVPLAADMPDLVTVKNWATAGMACYNFDESLGVLKHRCKPEAIVPLMTHMLSTCQADTQSTLPLKPITDAMSNAVTLQQTNQPGLSSHLVPAMLQAGWFDLNPARSFEQGVKHGQLAVMAHFEGRVDWDLFISRTKTANTTAVASLGLGDNVGVLAMVEQARRAGREDAALHQFMNGDFLSARAAKALLTTSQGVEVLPKLLAIGLRPDVPMETSRVSLHDEARNLKAAGLENNPALDILNSFVARTKAHALIDELDEQKAGHALR